jgi:hypothetical protein
LFVRRRNFLGGAPSAELPPESVALTRAKVKDKRIEGN